jgi:hypothetical protein
MERFASAKRDRAWRALKVFGALRLSPFQPNAHKAFQPFCHLFYATVKLIEARFPNIGIGLFLFIFAAGNSIRWKNAVAICRTKLPFAICAKIDYHNLGFDDCAQQFNPIVATMG